VRKWNKQNSKSSNLKKKPSRQGWMLKVLKKLQQKKLQQSRPAMSNLWSACLTKSKGKRKLLRKGKLNTAKHTVKLCISSKLSIPRLSKPSWTGTRKLSSKLQQMQMQRLMMKRTRQLQSFKLKKLPCSKKCWMLKQKQKRQKMKPLCKVTRL